MKSLFLDKLDIHASWKDFLSGEILKLITGIEKEVSKDKFTPPAEKVLRLLEFPLEELKIIIIGQDPYPQQGVATGRAFEVGNLKSWNEPFRNISLKNMLRALFKAYTGENILYNKLVEKLDNEFPVLPPAKLFQHWENQGVLLLNTSFTCMLGKPGSHRNTWKDFTFGLFHFINDNAPEATWFLWGNHAVEATSEIEIKNKIITHHPMMCYKNKNRQNDFLFGKLNCFESFIDVIDWTGYNLNRNFLTSGKLF